MGEHEGNYKKYKKLYHDYILNNRKRYEKWGSVEEFALECIKEKGGTMYHTIRVTADLLKRPIHLY